MSVTVADAPRVSGIAFGELELERRQKVTHCDDEMKRWHQEHLKRAYAYQERDFDLEIVS